MPDPDACKAVDRAAKILRIVQRFYDSNDARAAVTDVLADLRHFCDAHDLDFADCDRIAYDHYQAERPDA